MKIGVCIKSTPDTDTRIKLNEAGNGISEAGIKWVISPYDLFAVEEGVLTKEATGGEVVLFTASDRDVSKNLRDALALGPDRAVFVQDPLIASADALGVATTLAKAIQAEDCHVVFTGKQAIDDDNVQVPAMIAELLGWPHVSFVTDFSVEGETFTAVRAIGSGIEEVISGSLPVVITAERGMNSPRYAKLPMIMKAKKKPLDIKSAADLGLSSDDLAPAVVLKNHGLPPGRPAGRILEGDAATTAKELVRLLREEAKVI